MMSFCCGLCEVLPLARGVDATPANSEAPGLTLKK